MSNISDLIESYLKNSSQTARKNLEIQRSELAVRFSCVPSQINYVLTTVFHWTRVYCGKQKGGAISDCQNSLTSGRD